MSLRNVKLETTDGQDESSTSGPKAEYSLRTNTGSKCHSQTPMLSAIWSPVNSWGIFAIILSDVFLPREAKHEDFIVVIVTFPLAVVAPAAEDRAFPTHFL
jgi:hypothetical protein